MTGEHPSSKRNRATVALIGIQFGVVLLFPVLLKLSAGIQFQSSSIHFGHVPTLGFSGSPGLDAAEPGH